jgi:TatD DNase family protein
MKLVDTHTHLDNEAFRRDLAAVISRARDAGVTTMVAIGTDRRSSEETVALAARFPEVVAIVGIHPHEAGRITAEAVEGLRDLLDNPRVVGLGETGLDYFRDFAPRAAQVALFRAHLSLARQTGHPVVIHCRDAFPEVMEILGEFPDVIAVMHVFSGSVEVAHECLRRGYYISFGGPVTYPNARQSAEVAKIVLPDRMLVETDAPYLTPHPHRGTRNEPAYVRLVAERLAMLRGESTETIAELTTANAQRVFRLAGVEAPV